MAISAVRGTDVHPIGYMRFSISANGVAARQNLPVVSVRTAIGEKMRDVLSDPANLRPLYTRKMETMVGFADFSGHGYGETPYDAGLGWKYTRKSADETLVAISRTIGMGMTEGEDAFLRDHIIPLLPETFWGSSQDFNTPGYDDGPPFYNETPAVNRSAEEISAWLKQISPFSDVSRFFNSRPCSLTLGQSIIDKIRELLAS